LSHQNRRRLDAECLLDAILATSDDRDDLMGGSTIPAGISEDYGFVNRSRRRAVYWPVLRNALPEMFDLFDFADPSLPSGSRSTTTVASQSLFFLNDDWIDSQARISAARIVAEPVENDVERIKRVFLRILGRLPREEDYRIVQQSLATSGQP